jgi:hypothetical protein
MRREQLKGESNMPAPEKSQNPELGSLYAAFIGKNHAYYQRRWDDMTHNGNRFSFNWAAFFLAFLWLAYRKMYLYSVLYIFFIVIETTAEVFLDAPYFVSGAITLIYGVATGGYANYVYKRHADRLLADLSAAPPEAAQAEARRRGGTSLVAAAAAGLLFLGLLGVLIGAAYFIGPAFIDAADPAGSD